MSRKARFHSAHPSRRRFLAIAGAACGLVGTFRATEAGPVAHWVGTALGARATIRLRHPDAHRIVAALRAEIERLEQIFSLYRSNSAISRLNAAGRLGTPPFELLEVLSLCGSVHAATGGLFDPTVQPLWAMYAEHCVRGIAPAPHTLRSTLGQVGWGALSFSPDRIAFAKPGMALTLNGIAQGYIADKVAALLRREGIGDVLIDTGELVAIGGNPDGGDWPVELSAGDPAARESTNLLRSAWCRDDEPLVGTVRDGRQCLKRISLREAGLASSSPLGTVLDQAGTIGHILDPRTGLPTRAVWKLVTVRSPTATLADALSTAMCLMSHADMIAALGYFPGTELVHLA